MPRTWCNDFCVVACDLGAEIYAPEVTRSDSTLQEADITHEHNNIQRHNEEAQNTTEKRGATLQLASFPPCRVPFSFTAASTSLHRQSLCQRYSCAFVWEFDDHTEFSLCIPTI